MRVLPAAIPHHPLLAAEPLPRVRQVSVERSGRWLERGFRDFKAHPGIGLAYGAVFAFFGWLLTFGLAGMGMGSLILPLTAGFMLVGPLAAVGLYEVSRRRELGQPVTLAATLAAPRRHGQQIANMGLVLLILFFIWVQLAMILFALFHGGSPPALGLFLDQVVLNVDGLPFLLTGTLVGGLVAALTFALSVVSVPMLLDRDVLVTTAMRTSLAAVWANRLNMAGWAATLACLGAAGMAFFFVGLMVTLPVAAFASWHAYRDMVERA